MRHKAILSLVISLLIGFALFIGSGFGAEKQGNAQAQTSRKGLSENDAD